MSLTGGAKFILTGGANYQIARSLRFRASASAYLNRTQGTPTSTQKWTFSTWIKRSGDNATHTPIYSGSGGSGGAGDQLTFYGSAIRLFLNGASSADVKTSALFRDFSAWSHLVVAVDTTQATAANRIRIYWNGVEITSFATASYPAQNYVMTQINAASNVNTIGKDNNTTEYANHYLVEAYVVDGQQLTPFSFGQTDATTGAWNPIKYTGTYGTNGFYLPFSDNSAATSTTIGKDSSGNGNNWTPSGISITAGVTNDSLVDTPTNYGSDTGAGGEVRGNYATLDPLAPSSNITVAEGNLKSIGISIIGSGTSTASIGVSTNKTVWETTIGGGVNLTYPRHGAFRILPYVPGANDNIPDAVYGGFSYANSGAVTREGSAFATVASFAANDVLRFELDPVGLTVAIFKNNSLLTTVTGLTAGTYFPGVTEYNGSFSYFNFGQRPFANTASSGFKALCTQNLPDPAIPKPSLFMDVNTRAGTGAAFSVTGKSFQPDLVWMKGRSGTTDHAIYDAVRTATKDLGSNLATDETTQAQGLTAFNSDGFSGGTLAKINTSAATYVDWMWKKGATPGIDVVSYTGNGANRTIAHALGVVPSMMLVKSRVTAGADTGWAVYHSALANTEYLKLETTAAKATGATYWNSTTPTSSVFSLGTAADTNTNSDTYINYLFTDIAGFSKFGSYTGNGSADGPMVWCGFRPKFILIKSSTAVDAWLIYDSARDTYNVMPDTLVPNTTAAEAAISGIDFLSNGFKLRTITTTPNAAQTYIFAAFAEAPFKTARAR